MCITLASGAACCSRQACRPASGPDELAHVVHGEVLRRHAVLSGLARGWSTRPSVVAYQLAGVSAGVTFAVRPALWPSNRRRGPCCSCSCGPSACGSSTCTMRARAERSMPTRHAVHMPHKLRCRRPARTLSTHARAASSRLARFRACHRTADPGGGGGGRGGGGRAQGAGPAAHLLQKHGHAGQRQGAHSHAQEPAGRGGKGAGGEKRRVGAGVGECEGRGHARSTADTQPGRGGTGVPRTRQHCNAAGLQQHGLPAALRRPPALGARGPALYAAACTWRLMWAGRCAHLHLPP